MKILICVLLWFAPGLDCLTQKCDFLDSNMYIDSVATPSKKVYECEIKDIQLLNDNDSVFTDSSLNQRSNSDVLMLDYFTGNIVKYIPNSIFTTFPNMEYFWITKNQQFEVFKSSYLKNARNLRVLRIDGNLIIQLDAHVFVEAANLQHINLRENKIQVINILAFSGLPKLKGVYLKSNQIVELHPSTFSNILTMEMIELLNNPCVNMDFRIVNKNFQTVRAEISRQCKFELDLKDLKELKAVDQIAQLKFEDLTRNINNITETIVRNQKTTDETITSIFEKINSLTQSIVETNEKKESSNSSTSEVQDLIKNLTQNFEAQIKLTQQNLLKSTLAQSKITRDSSMTEFKIGLLNEQVNRDSASLRALISQANSSTNQLLHQKFADSENSTNVKMENMTSIISSRLDKVAEDSKKLLNKDISDYLLEAEKLNDQKHIMSFKLIMDKIQKEQMSSEFYYDKSIRHLWTVLIVVLVIFSVLTIYLVLIFVKNYNKMKNMRVEKTGNINPTELVAFM